MKDLVNYAKSQIRDNPEVDEQYWLGFMDGAEAQKQEMKKESREYKESSFYKELGKRVCDELDYAQIHLLNNAISEHNDEFPCLTQILGNAMLMKEMSK